MPFDKLRTVSSSLALLALSACGLVRCGVPEPLGPSAAAQLYAAPLPPPIEPLSVYYLGHSLIGRDIPAMVAQLAGTGNRYDAQLGWGAPLKAHWGDAAINGFRQENGNPHFRPARLAAESGDYDAVVLTEMVEIRAAIEHYDSAEYLHRWARLIQHRRPDARVYLYETWHRLDDEEGWLERLDRDLDRYWETEILRRALAYGDLPAPIYVIPAGQVIARFVRDVEVRGGVGPIRDRADLFAREAGGARDPIHLSDLGAYLVALTIYSVLYHRDPTGLPDRLRRADGSAAFAPGPEAAALMQQVAWQVVTTYPKSGLPQAGEAQ